MFKSRKKKGNCSIHLEGDITIYTANELKEKFHACLIKSDSFEVDLSAVSELDTAGFQILLLAKRQATALGKTFQMVKHSQAVMDVFNIFNAASLFGDPLLISERNV